MTNDFYSLFDRPREPLATVTSIASAPRATGDLHPYAAAAIAAELQRLDELPRPWSPNSYWDQTTFDVACNLLEIANSPWSGYKTNDAERDLYAHAPADSKWGPRHHEAKWEQARKRVGAAGRPEPKPGERYELPPVTLLRERPTEAGLEVAPNAEQDAQDVAELIRERFPLLDFAHLLSTEDDGEEWIVEPILPARRLVALYSAPKVGKSLLMLEIAVGVALGREVLGVVPEVRKVLYVDFENDPRGDVKRRLEAMGFGPEDGAQLNEALCYLSFPTLAKLDTPQGGYEILTTAQEYGCEVVVIDTVSRAVGGEENDNDTWLAFYRNTGMLLKGAGIACIRLDHSGKDVEKGMRGGSAKYGDVDAVWKLTTDSPGGTVLELICTDHRMPLEEDRLTLVRDSEPALRHRVIGDRSVALDAKERELDEALDRLSVESSISVRAAKKLLRDNGVTFKNPVLERVLKARRMRLPGASPAPLGDASPARPPAPSPPSVPKGGLGGDSPPSPGGHPEDEVTKPLFVVACKKCRSSTHRDVAHANGGLCADCARDAGLVT